MWPQPPVRHARPSWPTPKTLEPVPEIAPTPGSPRVAVAQAATTSLTTSHSGGRCARTSETMASVSVPATASTAASSASTEAPAPASASSAASSSACVAASAPTASWFDGPPWPRCRLCLSTSSTAASVLVAPPSIPSRKRGLPPLARSGEPPEAFGGASSGGSWTSGERSTGGILAVPSRKATAVASSVPPHANRAQAAAAERAWRGGPRGVL
jgi:hypothetical protein